MLRLLIGMGLLLMLVGFGAAGFQYWQSLPSDRAPQLTADVADPAGEVPQTWLISATGGLASRADYRAYLSQDRFVPSRNVTVLTTAPLTTLLAEGETLPELPYLPVFADIRAPTLAQGLCPALMSAIARDCAVNAARVVEGSVDSVMGTARFEIDLVYLLKPDAAELPDLATQVFVQTPFAWEGGPETPTVEAALTALANAALAACTADGVGAACRVTGLSLDFDPGVTVSGSARLGWLAPLPEGVFTAPSLDPAPEG